MIIALYVVAHLFRIVALCIGILEHSVLAHWNYFSAPLPAKKVTNATGNDIQRRTKTKNKEVT